jgi:hypothetical protein
LNVRSSEIERVLNVIDGVRGVFGALLLGGIAIAAIAAGGTWGWTLGAVLIAAALAGILWIAHPRRFAEFHWWWFRYRRLFKVHETQCSSCGRTLAVIPAELEAYGKRRGARLIAKAPRDAVRAQRNGFFECRCGALGWVFESFVRPPAHRSAPPTAAQRRILESLAVHPEGVTDIEFERSDEDMLATRGELVFAKERGWVTAKLAGIGGMAARVPVIYELTDQGKAALG